MLKVKCVIFRYLTDADFFNIYKPSRTEERGGGQAYIDFPIASISLNKWGKFFDGAVSVYCGTAEQGPSWEFPVSSIGQSGDQEVKVYQRRAQSICIASQRITSQRENRVEAWHPNHGFPEPKDPTKRNEVPKGLVIYLVRTMNDEFWAGWSLGKDMGKTPAANAKLEKITNSSGEGDAGFLEFNGSVEIDTNEASSPFN